MPRLIEPELLHTFAAIADSGSFTEAARRVFRTQSAVSMQMKRLEELIGRPVFARSGRGVELTRDGELLLGHARRILRLHHEALAAFSDPDLEGTVTLGTPDQYASLFLPRILARFAETHPRIHVEVVCDVTASLMRRLAEGGIDLALVTQDVCQTSGVILLREPVVWATATRHCVHEQSPLPLALFHAGCNYRKWAVDALDGVARPYRVAYSSMSWAGINAALRAGLALSAVPRSSIGEGLRVLGEAEGFPPLPDYQVALLRARERRSPLLDRLEEHIVESFQGGVAAAAA
jgi:DNA-binding transcriptional LysR family regulator